MESVYLETTFISYLVSPPSRDLVVAAHQQLTRDWWEQRRDHFRCVVSQVVRQEISAGDQAEARKRLEIADSLDVLAASPDAETLTDAIMNARILPARAVQDAAHVAVATVHSVQYLLTWNCKHLANAQISKQICDICSNRGFDMPQICTPEELLEEPNDEK